MSAVTLEEMIEEAAARGYILDCLRQLNTDVWYASFRKGNDVVYDHAVDAHATTPRNAMATALFRVLMEAA